MQIPILPCTIRYFYMINLTFFYGNQYLTLSEKNFYYFVYENNNLLHYSETMDKDGAQGFLERFKGCWKRQMEANIEGFCGDQDSYSGC